jgi:hypothetical protein
MPAENVFIGLWHRDRQWRLSVRPTLAAIVIYLGLAGGVMAQQRVHISSDWGKTEVAKFPPQ